MNAKSVAEMRMSYELGTLGDRDVLHDPIEQFSLWFDEVRDTSIAEANAMVVATVTPEGVPQARTVLMKSFDHEGLVFYTNYESAKGQAIELNPNVCALFYWPSLQRQVRWTGVATRVSPEQSDEYFASRPRGSQFGAIASDQSAEVESADVVRDRWNELERQYGEDAPVPRPEHWGGYRIRPTSIEFWQGRENRLHDRILFTREADDSWHTVRLAP